MKAQGMVDIETASSRPDAAVIAIGVCLFDDKEVWDPLEILIDPTLAPGHRDPGTIKWWYEQEEHVRMKMWSGTTSPWEACDLFRRYFTDLHPGVKILWANPPTFDIVILRHLFRLYDVEFPIHYTGERDFRTMRKLAEEQGVDYDSAYAERDAHHDAVDDAITQAKALQLILTGLALT